MSPELLLTAKSAFIALLKSPTVSQLLQPIRIGLPVAASTDVGNGAKSKIATKNVWDLIYLVPRYMPFSKNESQGTYEATGEKLRQITRKDKLKRKIFPILIIVALFGVLLFAMNREPRLNVPIDGNDALVPDAMQPPSNSISSESLEVDQIARQLDSGDEPIGKSKSLVWDQLQSDSYWNLIAEHWAKAGEGNADSMLIVHTIMYTCRIYRKRFNGKHLAEVQESFSANNDPELYALNEAIWQHCGPIYENWDQYNGWREMLEGAANNGQPYAMVMRGQALLSDAATFHEAVALLNSALYSADVGAIAQMTNIYRSAGVDADLSYGWLVAACELGLDCSPEGAFMANTCGPFSKTCGIHESVQDFLIREIGGHGYEMAEQRAAVIVNAIVTERVDDLKIELDLDQP